MIMVGISHPNENHQLNIHRRLQRRPVLLCGLRQRSIGHHIRIGGVCTDVCAMMAQRVVDSWLMVGHWVVNGWTMVGEKW